MSVSNFRFISVFCSIFLIIPGTLFAANDTHVIDDSKHYRAAAMLCLVQHDWYEAAVATRKANVPRESLLRIVDGRFGKPALIGFKHAANYAIAYVYQYSPQTDEKYSELGDKLLDKCLNGTHISKYKHKVTNCIKNMDVAGDIFTARDKGTKLADAEKKFQPLLAGDEFSTNVVKEIYKSKKSIYAFRMDTFSKCAQNIDTPEVAKQTGSK